MNYSSYYNAFNGSMSLRNMGYSTADVIRNNLDPAYVERLCNQYSLYDPNSIEAYNIKNHIEAYLNGYGVR